VFTKRFWHVLKRFFNFYCVIRPVLVTGFQQPLQINAFITLDMAILQPSAPPSDVLHLSGFNVDLVIKFQKARYRVRHSERMKKDVLTPLR